MNEREQHFKRVLPYYDLDGEFYALWDCFPIAPEIQRELKRGMDKIGQIYEKFFRLLRHVDDDVLLALGFPESVLPYVRLSVTTHPTIIGRGDWVWTKQGPKMLEFNTDTPTFIQEVYRANGAACKKFRFKDPNQGEERHLRKAMQIAVAETKTWLNLAGDPYVVFTAHHRSLEDYSTAQYLWSVLGKRNSAVFPLDEVYIDKEGLWDPHGRKIDILYRQTYPMEFLIDDKDDQDRPIGTMLLDLVTARRVGILNPISAFLLQNKAIQAVIWGLGEEQNQTFFTIEEVDAIRQYLLPTYLEKEPLLQTKYVQKPIFGREGNTVQIYSQDGTLYRHSPQHNYTYPSVFQQYVELPTTTVSTPYGNESVYFLYGVFFLNGAASALGIRASTQEITDNGSWFLPVGLT